MSSVMPQAVPVPAGAPRPVEGPRDLRLRFHGNAREYFRVWIVNLCLTLVTLGIFSAWAKVRKKRYFYSHTTLDGTPFQYLGQPIPILKGRVIAAVLFSVYYVSSHFFTSLLPFVLVAAAVLAPWVIVRSAAFNARYSAFRNMTFHFDAGYRTALKEIYVYGLVPGLMIVGVVAAWRENPVLAGVAFLALGFGFPWWMQRLKRFIVTHSGFGNENAEFGATGGNFFKVYFLGSLIVAAGGGVAGALAAAIFAGGKPPPSTFVLAFSIPVYIAYIVAFAYIQSRLGNLVWNKSRLGPLHFESTLRARGLMTLYFGNAVAIVASLGLLTPWAVIRTIRYRLEHMRVLLDGELTAFRGNDTTSVRAAGAEIGEMFDVDLSL